MPFLFAAVQLSRHSKTTHHHIANLVRQPPGNHLHNTSRNDNQRSALKEKFQNMPKHTILV